MIKQNLFSYFHLPLIEKQLAAKEEFSIRCPPQEVSLLLRQLKYNFSFDNNLDIYTYLIEILINHV